MLVVYLSLLLVMGGARGATPAHKPHYPASAHAQLFAEFKATYSKRYASLREDQLRFTVFKGNLAKINELNAKSERTVYGINQFTDLTAEEFIAQYTGLKVDRSQVHVPPPLTNMTTAAPAAFDWRDKNVVTRVKNQGVCGSCWAFATIGSLESNYARKTGTLQEFSEQQLVDCDTMDGGCVYGGHPDRACRYIQQSGSMREADYPYADGDGSCAYNAGRVVVHSTECNNYAGSSEDQIRELIFNKGPIAIALDAHPLHHYQGGVIETECHYNHHNHAVLLVGYGTDYWIVKNSWGTVWGENGYFRMKMGVGCLAFNTLQVVPVEV